MVFDAHKLDISDEFKHAIEAIRAQDDKIRIILNKVFYLSMHVYNFKQEKELIIYTGRHDDPPTADEGVWSAAVVPLKNPGKPRGGRSRRYWRRFLSVAHR